jgi:hypothetical protein
MELVFLSPLSLVGVTLNIFNTSERRYFRNKVSWNSEEQYGEFRPFLTIVRLLVIISEEEFQSKYDPLYCSLNLF